MRQRREIYVDGNIALVALTQGKVAMIDISDIEIVDGYNWYAVEASNGFYARRSTWNKNEKKGSVVEMQRHILCPPDGLVADHINRDTLDNRRSNLRSVLPHQNCINRVLSSGKKLKGVCLRKSGRWQARLIHKEKSYFGGTHASEEEAARAYDEIAFKLHGSIALLNFPREATQ